MRAVLAIALCALGCAAPRPPRLPIVDGWHGPFGVVAFTFDDGPDERTTPAILDALDHAGVRATFFVVGNRVFGSSPQAAARRAILRDEVERGYAVGTHTFAHASLRGASANVAGRAIDDGIAAVAAVIGRRPTLFRPPYGKLSPGARDALRARGLIVVRWDIDPTDYRDDAATLRRRVREAIQRQGGGIVVLHDTKAVTAAALPGILADLADDNCARLAAGRPPIIPVGLEWFLVDAAGRVRPPSPAARASAARARRRISALCHISTPWAVDMRTPRD